VSKACEGGFVSCVMYSLLLDVSSLVSSLFLSLSLVSIFVFVIASFDTPTLPPFIYLLVEPSLVCFVDVSE